MIAAKDCLGDFGRKDCQVQKARDILPMEASPLGKLPHRANLALSNPLVPCLRLSDCSNHSGIRAGLLGARLQNQSNLVSPFCKMTRRPQSDLAFKALSSAAQKLGAESILADLDL